VIARGFKKPFQMGVARGTRNMMTMWHSGPFNFTQRSAPREHLHVHICSNKRYLNSLHVILEGSINLFQPRTGEPAGCLVPGCLLVALNPSAFEQHGTRRLLSIQDSAVLHCFLQISRPTKIFSSPQCSRHESTTFFCRRWPRLHWISLRAWLPI
jgi:hypothetical protein